MSLRCCEEHGERTYAKPLPTPSTMICTLRRTRGDGMSVRSATACKAAAHACRHALYASADMWKWDVSVQY